jgi:fatty-acyl-CoA synthase
MGLISTIKREWKYLSGVRRVLNSVKDVTSDSEHLIADELEARVDKFGPNLAFIEGERTFTFDEFDAYANRVANWAIDQGLEAGDTVAIFARNRLEYVALWFGFSKVGIIPALLNYQLTGQALAHCVEISDAKIILIDIDMVPAWKATKKLLKTNVKPMVAFGETKGLESFDVSILETPPHRPARTHREGITAGEQCMKMFTSGTTGMPKAAKVTHVRATNYMRAFAAAAQTKPSDRVLMVLPMYHATGGLCGVGAGISHGGSVIVEPKFSATKFWDVAVKQEATVFMYVGELCRFLLSTAPV